MSGQQLITSGTQVQESNRSHAYAESPEITIDEIDALFLSTLNLANQLSKRPFSENDDGPYSQELAMAKMLNYCIRMLHSDAWVPRTVVRAMAHLEIDGVSMNRSQVERTGRDSVKGVMYRAMREMIQKRKENQSRKMKIARPDVSSEKDNRAVDDRRNIAQPNGVNQKKHVNTDAGTTNAAEPRETAKKPVDQGSRPKQNGVHESGAISDAQTDNGVCVSELTQIDIAEGDVAKNDFEAK